MTLRPAIIPCLVYQDAHAAIAFLCDAFGFSAHAVYESADKTMVEHAQLTLEGNMVMLGSASRESCEQFNLVTPAAAAGRVTTTLYVVLADPDAHHAKAVAAGAAIINPPRDQDYGGRTYEARDTEGHVWSFGSYDPFQIFPDDTIDDEQLENLVE